MPPSPQPSRPVPGGKGWDREGLPQHRPSLLAPLLSEPVWPVTGMHLGHGSRGGQGSRVAGPCEFGKHGPPFPGSRPTPSSDGCSSQGTDTVTIRQNLTVKVFRIWLLSHVRSVFSGSADSLIEGVRETNHSCRCWQEPQLTGTKLQEKRFPSFTVTALVHTTYLTEVFYSLKALFHWSFNSP